MPKVLNTTQLEDWCFRSETARLLALNVAQIHTGLNEGDSSIEALSNSFQQIASFCLAIEKLEDSDKQPLTLEQIQSIATSMSSQINQAIIAFQFYDRLCQRLEHVQANLHALSELVTNDTHIQDDRAWRLLRDKIKAGYTMSTEHKMHEAVMLGASIEQALQIYREEMANKLESVDVELF